ncbi:ATP-binding cassette sub- C member 8 [Aphanomyces cochlioides]|nr:ATP-binding cassette sub- C member 8 [Aphanomyces cochlioides]KAG9410510.1 ATP-binding cassette sub- C member 8 [Aphanomyces cochlioides]
MSERSPLLQPPTISPRPHVASPSTWTSVLFFSWLSPILKLGYEKTLEFDDLYTLSPVHESKFVFQQFQSRWSKLKASTIPPAKPSVLRALLTVFGWRILLAGVLRLIRATLLFTAPLVLKAMIAFLKKNDAPTSRGYYLAAIIFVSGIVQSLSIRQYSYLSQEIGMCFRAAIQSAVYQKSLVIAPSAKRSSGQVTNLMSVDAMRVQKLAVDLHSIWGIPYLILLSCVLLWQEIGVSFLAGLGVIALFIPLTLFAAKYMKSIQKIVMMAKDARTKLCNEVWGGIKVIKFQAWEKALLESIQTKRATELDQLRVFLRLRSLASALSSSLPAFVATASFSKYICLGNSLDVGTALTTMALFNILRLPLQNIPDIMNSIVEALLSLDRIRDYLLEEERLDITSGALESPGVVLRDATLQIPQTDEPFLENVNFKASSRSLVALVGPTGSGKSSFLRAILGDALVVNGRLFKNGSIAYVAQHPFILNATIRENILFGLPFDQARYTLALSCCCLNDDLATLGAGDLTEIGDRGSTLSGGQRTLIALARAIYQDASIYLLDDVLASVDNHVGAHVFRECIKGALQDKLVILVTNASNVLGSCDRVVVLENKVIAADGPLAEVQNHPYLVNLRRNSQSTGDSKNTGIRPTAGVSAEIAKAPSGRAISAKLIADEDRTRGVTSWRVYSVWLQACGGWPMVLLVISIYVVCEGMSVAASMWLSFWSEHGDSTTVWFYMGVFVVLQLTSVLFVYFRASELYMAGIRGSESLFESILGHLLTAPMSFFDSTPLGRLANRFAADVYTADESLSATWGALLATAITVMSTLATIIGVTPLFLVMILPIGYGYARTQLYYIKTSRELQRLVSISKSPVLSFFGETLDGLSTIRALPGIPDVFTARMHSILDRNLQAILLDFSVDCWLTLRLDVVGTLISTFAALCAVLQHGSTSAMFAGLAGVALSYAFTITKNMTQSVTNYSSLQTQMVAIERLDAYAHLPREDTQSLIRQRDDIDKAWPPAGAVEFDQVRLRYQPQLPLVLHNVTFSIPPRAKVGIVGRTGAGKSSLTAALFRLVELASGSIFIDGVNIATLPLSTLRHAVSIIPQDPVLFSGSIRFNLDPTGEADDKALWQVVHRAHLASITSLDAVVEERGLNFSLGERQLVCIARALLKQSKVIVMDEATASIDLNADRLIQATVREVFADCTTITIAHRLDTILDADAVLVMDQGVVAEIGAPAQLLQDSDSLFYQLSKRHAML